MRWNAPLYAHLGFVALTEDEVQADGRLLAVRAEEARHGLDVSTRTFMRRGEGHEGPAVEDPADGAALGRSRLFWACSLGSLPLAERGPYRPRRRGARGRPVVAAVCEPAAVSITVKLEDLADVIAERGRDAYLVTVRDTRPHVVAVSVAHRTGVLVVGAGRRTAINIVDRPLATLLWPVSADHPNHSLLVDGTARLSDDGGWLEVTPTSAILHRAGGRRRAPADDETARAKPEPG